MRVAIALDNGEVYRLFDCRYVAIEGAAMSEAPEVEHTFACAFAQRGAPCDCGHSEQYVRGFDYSSIADYCDTGPEDEAPITTPPNAG